VSVIEDKLYLNIPIGYAEVEDRIYQAGKEIEQRVSRDNVQFHRYCQMLDREQLHKAEVPSRKFV